MKHFLLIAFVALIASASEPQKLQPAKMKRIGSVDKRFQSFNVEMVEVTGGRFWAPYKSSGTSETATGASGAPAGVDPAAFRMRPPIDLSNPRLRQLAAALGPSYVRVSGSWANSTFFRDSDQPTPAGFGGVLTPAEWRGVVDFAKAVDAKIVTSFAISTGVRDSNGVWTPAEARKFLAFNKSIGGEIAAAELFNEPNFAAMGGAPKGYDAAAYARDFKVFRAFLKEAAPEIAILGPGSVNEATFGADNKLSIVKSEDMLKGTGPGVDAFSYHFYGSVSKRCAAMDPSAQTSPEAALSLNWLSRTEKEYAFYAALRDKYEPGKPLWLTETGETACGGNPWAATFTDTFRYLNQLGTLAQHSVQVVAHNTLAASDYGLIDEATLEPRPNYYAALLWHKNMGEIVLDPGPSPSADLHLYAHCLAGHPGGVAILAINADKKSAYQLDVPKKSDGFTMTETDVNPKPQSIPAGRVSLAPATVTFLAIPSAANPACR